MRELRGTKLLAVLFNINTLIGLLFLSVYVSDRHYNDTTDENNYAV